MKFVIIGLGQVGRSLAQSLIENGFEVSVIDVNEGVVSEMKDKVTYAQVGDASDARVLSQMELVGDDINVIVAIGEGFERGILIAAQLKELGVKNLYVRSVNVLHSRVLKLMGVNELFRVEDVAAKQLAARFVHSGFMQLRKIDKTHALAEVTLPSEWVGKSLRDVDLRRRFKLNMLTLRRGAVQVTEDDDLLAGSEQPVIDTPEPELLFQEGDILVLFGKESDLSSFVNHFDL